jgi:hypothetical protein
MRVEAPRKRGFEQLHIFPGAVTQSLPNSLMLESIPN